MGEGNRIGLVALLLAASACQPTDAASEHASAGSVPGPGASAQPSRAPRPDVLIVGIDGLGLENIAELQADPSLAVTPGLDRLATEGTVYFDAYATSPWCAETLTSALTGELSASLGEAPTLAEHLSHLGYRTALLLASDSHRAPAAADSEAEPPMVRGFDQILEVADSETTSGARADEVARVASEWLQAAPGPSLLVVTLADPRPPHHLYDGLIEAADVPYEGPVTSGLDHAELLRRGPSLSKNDRARLVELHASEVAMADRAFSRIAGAMIDRRTMPPVLVAFGLRRPALGAAMPAAPSSPTDAGSQDEVPRHYGLVPAIRPEALVVPLLIRFPAAPRTEEGAPPEYPIRGDVAVPVSIADLTPTLLDALGLPPRLDIHGRSILPGAGLPDRAIVATSTRGVRAAVVIEATSARAVRVAPLSGQAFRRSPGGAWEPATPVTQSVDPATVDWAAFLGLAKPEELIQPRD